MRHPHLPLPLLVLLLLPAALLAQRPLTPPLRIDTPGSYLQGYPAVAASANGDFAVTWLEETPGLFTLHARRFSADGTPVTEDLQIPGLAFLQDAAAMREDGSFLVGFVTETGLMVRIYGPDGTLLHESLVSGVAQYPAFAVRPDGTFLVAWDGAGTLFAQVFGEDGLPLAPERRIAPSTSLAAPPQVAAGPDGGFVLAWSRVRATSANPFLNNFTLFAQRLGPSGAPRGAAITVRPETSQGASTPGLARDAAGNFLVVWNERSRSGEWDILGRRYTSAGAPASGLLKLEPTAGNDVPRLTMDPAGNFVVAWIDDGTPQQKVLAQRFTAGGTPFRPVFQVGTTPTVPTSVLGVASAANGNFVVAWGFTDGIYVRVYNKR